MPRFDYVWWVLAANPFVILADATPTAYSRDGYPIDLFGQIKAGVRGAQLPSETNTGYDECDPSANTTTFRSPEQIEDETVPSWFVGLAGQIVLAAGLLWGAWARTRTPARALPPGTRIA